MAQRPGINPIVVARYFHFCSCRKFSGGLIGKIVKIKIKHSKVKSGGSLVNKEFIRRVQISAGKKITAFCGWWWPDPGSNWGHTDFQSVALPTELSGRAAFEAAY